MNWRNGFELISNLFSMSTPNSGSTCLTDLNGLETVLRRIQALIRDYEGSLSSSSMPETDECRLEDLKEVAFAADDVLDEYMYHVLRARIETRIEAPYRALLDEDLEASSSSSRKSKCPEEDKKEVFDSLPIPVMVPPPEELGNRAMEIIERFNMLTIEWETLRLWETDGHRRVCVDGTGNKETSSFVMDVHGRGQDKEKVIDRLFSENSSRSIAVVCINGMAGIGKTTLAQMIYNDTRVVEGFDLRGWICVAGDFNAKILFDKIIQAFTKSNCELREFNLLQEKLHEEVRGKRFFLVLDDVWNDTSERWDKLLAPLGNAKFGRIVVTSRITNAANIRQAECPYPLGELPNDNCLSLFEQMVFEGGLDKKKHPDLIEIGNDIVKKCKGSPMAVKALGASLRGKPNKSDWDEIRTSELWDLGEIGCDGFPAMRLSYDRMPLRLKQCFIFFSLFPKGYLFFKDDIVRLWMSLGLLKHEGKISMEAFGNVLVEDLSRLSMIQRAPDGEAKEGFTLHDLVHNLAAVVAGKDFKTMEDAEFNRIDYDTLKSISRKRYLSIILQSLENTIGLQPLQGSTALRVLQFVDQRNKWNNRRFNVYIPNDLFQSLKHLRALDFSNVVIKTLPNSVINLIHLRYLALTNTGIEKLPEFICCLHNLETLELTRCPIKQLPQGIKNLVKLRHLNFQRLSHVCMPHGMGQLSNLRTMPWFDVGSDGWHCEISELRGLVNIGGEICIAGLKSVACAEKAKEADLQNKRNITVLKLEWLSHQTEHCEHALNGYVTTGPKIVSLIHDQVIESLRPHYGLKELYIDHYCGSKFPNWLVDGRFTELVKVSLIGTGKGCESLPALGQLPLLKNLSIKSMFSVKRIGREFCSSGITTKAFQKLEMLEFRDMIEWSEWSEVETAEFCSLRTLKLIYCPKLRSFPQPLSSSLTKLVVEDCDKLSRLPILHSLSCLILRGRLNEEMFCSMVLPALRILKVCKSDNIKTLYLSYDKPLLLEVVVIQRCRNLHSVVGFSSLNSLKLLKIQRCPKLELSQTEIPPMLRHLKVSHCPKLEDWIWEDQLLRKDDSTNDEELKLIAELSEAEDDIDVN